MSVLMEPLVDAMSNIIAGDHFVDMASPEAMASMNAVLTAVEAFLFFFFCVFLPLSCCG